ncbi:hypothetical protein OF83DRAFT_584078 [Amylostereum chailletii]|nr:hypothetical protein OF83DRAFT_584078 [Amylostereum chailletii]
MRVKSIIANMPVLTQASRKVKLFWDRVTASRLTTFYFVFSFVHCVIQLIFQAEAFFINVHAAQFLFSIVQEGNATAHGFFVLKDDLWFCDHVPDDFNTSSCQIVWNGTILEMGSLSQNGAAGPNYSYSLQSASSAISSRSSSPTLSQASATITPSQASTALSSSAAPSTSASQTSASASASSASAVTSPVSTITQPATSSVQTSAAQSTTVPSAPPVLIGDDSDDEDSDDEGSDDGGSDSGDEDSDDEDEKFHTDVLLAHVASDIHDHGSRDVHDLQFFTHGDSQGDLSQIRAIDVNGELSVTLTGFGFDHKDVTLSRKCLWALNWPLQALDNTKREDIAFIGFQFWVLGMSIVAILNESIPHIIASLLTHLSATVWGGYQISSTDKFHDDFKRLTTAGACQINLLPNYWSARAGAEIPSLALNSAALLLSLILSWKLFKLFGWQTFKRVGASRAINRVYKLVLTLSVVIQLSLFFVIVTVALWLDQICNGAIGKFATSHKAYEATLILVLLLLPVWLVSGWFAVRKELRIPMMIFLIMSTAYIVGWASMFDSKTYRWTFAQWAFFAVMSVISAVLTLICLVVGIFCRINFGKGLPHYLNAEESLPGDDFIRVTPEKGYSDPEKIDFPSADQPIPTYTAAFGDDMDMPPPPGSRRLGPRFYSQDTVPFELPSDVRTTTISVPSLAYSSPSDTTSHSGLPTSVRPLVRHGTQSSQSSFESTRSGNTTISNHSRSDSQEGSHIGRSRWVIE